MLAGVGRETNLFYRTLRSITSPLIWITRRITPRKLAADAAIGWAAFFLVLGLWLALTIVKVQLVLEASGGASLR